MEHLKAFTVHTSCLSTNLNIISAVSSFSQAQHIPEGGCSCHQQHRALPINPAMAPSTQRPKASLAPDTENSPWGSSLQPTFWLLGFCR